MHASSQGSTATDAAWGIVVQARMGSTRLPGKMLLDVVPGHKLLATVLERLLAEQLAGRIVLATSTSAADTPLAELAHAMGIAVHRGSESDVLDRFLGAAQQMGWKYLVRVCADNPLLQTNTIAPLAAAGLKAGADYAGYFYSDGLPSIRSHCGLFAEWAAVSALERVATLTKEREYREHVTNYLYGHPEMFHTVRLPVPFEEEVRNWRATVDTTEDLALCSRILAALGTDASMDLEQLRTYLNEHPGIVQEMRVNIQAHAK